MNSWGETFRVRLEPPRCYCHTDATAKDLAQHEALRPRQRVANQRDGHGDALAGQEAVSGSPTAPGSRCGSGDQSGCQ